MNHTLALTRFARQRQQGAALIVGLVLLLVLTVLGVTGINISTLELRMTENEQANELAFQAAETGIDIALSGPVSTAAPVTYTDVEVYDASPDVQYSAQLACVGTTRVPDGAYSDNESAQALHFDATSVGIHDSRNAVSSHTQSVYIVGPAPANPNFNPAAGPGSC